MSSIREKISEELKTAMKAKDTERLGTIRLIKAELIKKETEKNASEMDEAGLFAMLRTMIKQREDSIAQFEKAGRQELADKEHSEIKVISTFLPAPLSADDLSNLVNAVIAELGATDVKGMGPVVKEVMARAAGAVDGKSVSSLVRERLGA